MRYFSRSRRLLRVITSGDYTSVWRLRMMIGGIDRVFVKGRTAWQILHTGEQFWTRVEAVEFLDNRHIANGNQS